MRRLSRKQLLESRIRELKRKLLHTKDQVTRSIYTSHIDFLKGEIALGEV